MSRGPLGLFRGPLKASGGPLEASGGRLGVSGDSLGASGCPLGISGGCQDFLRGLRTFKGGPKCYLADCFNIVDGLKIKHSISMCLLVFERAYLSCFLTDFKKIYDEKKLEKKIFQMRLIPGL